MTKRHQQPTSVTLRLRNFNMITDANATASILKKIKRIGCSINWAAMGFISTKSPRLFANIVNIKSNRLTIHKTIIINRTRRARQAALSRRAEMTKDFRRFNKFPPIVFSRSADPTDMMFSLPDNFYHHTDRSLIQ